MPHPGVVVADLQDGAPGVGAVDVFQFDVDQFALFDAGVEHEADEQVRPRVGVAAPEAFLRGLQQTVHFIVVEDAGEGCFGADLGDGRGRVLGDEFLFCQEAEEDFEGSDASGHGFGLGRRILAFVEPVEEPFQVFHGDGADEAVAAQVFDEKTQVAQEGFAGVEREVPLAHVCFKRGQGRVQGHGLGEGGTDDRFGRFGLLRGHIEKGLLSGFGELLGHDSSSTGSVLGGFRVERLHYRGDRYTRQTLFPRSGGGGENRLLSLFSTMFEVRRLGA